MRINLVNNIELIWNNFTDGDIVTIVTVLSLTSLFIMVMMCLLVISGVILIKRWSVIDPDIQF